MANPSIDIPQAADPSPTDHPLDDEEIDTLGDSDITYLEDETDAADKTDVKNKTAEPVHRFLDFEHYLVNNVVIRRERKALYDWLRENLIERQDIRY